MESIAYEGRGTVGVPLILIHGFPLDRAMWQGQLDGLGQMARVVAVDLPGFGAPPPPPIDTLSMDVLADVVLGLADGLGFTRFVVGGMSMGGYVAMALARRYPGRLCGLILTNTRPEPDSTDARRQRLSDATLVRAQGVGFLIERQLRKMLSPETMSRRRDLVIAVETMMRRCSPEGMAAALRGMANRPDARAGLADINVPTLVITGADDVITPPAGAQQVAAHIRGAEMAVIPAAGHLAPFEAPDAVNAAIRKLLRRAQSAGVPGIPAPLEPPPVPRKKGR